MGRYAGEEYGDGSVSQDSWRALKTQHRMTEDRAKKAEAERDALRDERERLKFELQTLRSTPWHQRMERAEAERDALRERIERDFNGAQFEIDSLRNERDELAGSGKSLAAGLVESAAQLRALRERIRALADETPHKTTDHLGNVTGYLIGANELRAALGDA